MHRDDLVYVGSVRQRVMLATVRCRHATCFIALGSNPAPGSWAGRKRAPRSVCVDAALREADLAQQSLDRGDSRPLLGLPFAVKDQHDLAGDVSSEAQERLPSSRARLRSREDPARGGAIPVGKTTMPELGMHPFTDSVTWGVTRNPWDLRTPGGSSGRQRGAVPPGVVRDGRRRRRFDPHSGVVLQPLRLESPVRAGEDATQPDSLSEGCRCAAVPRAGGDEGHCSHHSRRVVDQLRHVTGVGSFTAGFQSSIRVLSVSA